MDTFTALRQRQSVRAYRQDPVPEPVIRDILDAARHAPSGVNMQPWQVAVVSGAARERLSGAILSAREAGQAENPDYRYYPADWFEPYTGRRKVCGLALYGALGIGRDDKEKRVAAWNANYRFFDAPVGLVVGMDRRLGQGAWLDLGMFMQSVMLAATARGLATCPEASFADYPDVIRGTLGLPPEFLVVAGMALGYADESAPVNGFRTDREPVDAFARFYQ
jgi:nitroreductase